MPQETFHTKNGLKLGIILSCILVPFLFSYAENDNQAMQSGVLRGDQSPVVSKPDIPKEIKQIQTLLALLKFDPGPIDGILGKKTAKAIRAFQLDIGVPATGKIDENLKSQLDAAYQLAVARIKEQTHEDKEKPKTVKKKPTVIASQDIKLYSQPELKGMQVGNAKLGAEFTVVCPAGKWFLVTTTDDNFGWVHESWITIDVQTAEEVKALAECQGQEIANFWAAKGQSESGVGMVPEVNRQKEPNKGAQKERTPKAPPMKPENPYFKYIKISFPIVAVIFLAYFYRIWTRSHDKKRDEKRPRKAESAAEKSVMVNRQEEYEALSEVQELEIEKTDFADGRTEFVQEEPVDYQDPSHPGYITPVVRRKVWIRNKGQCAACGSRRDLQYDYIVPIFEGGNNTLDNLQLLCKTCNQKKSDK